MFKREDFVEKQGFFRGLRLKIGIWVGNPGFLGFMEENWGFSEKIGVSMEKSRFS